MYIFSGSITHVAYLKLQNLITLHSKPQLHSQIH